MICAECGHESETPVESCSACGKDPLLDGRYRLLSVIGQGAFGTTWRGERASDGHVVCLKELLYQRLASFEPEEQFRREASVLRQLDLPGVPAYIDDFAIVTGRAVSLFLVQELVDGETLAEEMEHKRYREDEVLDVLAALLGILADLHELSPPVVHRDIKPTNVMRRADGSLVLIDFGAVKDVLNKTRRGGPSVAGTIGFMAPEQLTGHAEPATDLFGAGALAVALLSRRDPADLLDDAGRLDWKGHVSVSTRVLAFLESLLAPSIEQRPESAREAIAALAEARAEPVAVAPPEPKPKPQPLAPAPSPAEPQRSPALGMAAVSLAAAVAVGGLIYVARKPDTRPAVLPPPEYDVPRGILELELGMSFDQATASGADVEAGIANSVPEGVSLHQSPDPSPRLPGRFWGFSTSIAGQIARCQLEFADEERLSRIACSFDPFRTAQAFDATVRDIQQQLSQRYQLPTSVCVQPDDVAVMGSRSVVDCEWTDQTASLTLEGRFEDLGVGAPGLGDVADFMRSSELRLSLESARHTFLVHEQRSIEAREQQREIDAAAAERRAREEAERKRIEEAARRGL